MKIFLLSFFTFVNAFAVKAQVHWSHGVIVLKDATVVVGEMQFQSDVVVFRESTTTRIYPAHQVASFRYYDASSNINRHYLSLADPRFVFPVLRFFEVVTWGEIAVVRRDLHPLLTGTKDDTEYAYFSLKENELVPLKKFKARTYEAMLQRYPMLLRTYVATERLSMNRLCDVIRIIKFYNQQVYVPASMAAL
ncbi:MAG: hypothetical protein DI538_21870 [Azospira oryzae]|jgi:hypothetical protein|nr:MAG: hypothetical protein DI538_21870 [Azospira oryzae]